MTIELSTLLAGCLGAGAALGAPVVAYYLESKDYLSVTKSGRRSIKGAWRGITHQRKDSTGKPIEVDLSVEFYTRGKIIKGRSRVRGGGAELNVTFQGGFVSDTHLSLRYNAKDSSKVNFGYCLLTYNAEGKQLKGEMIGYGHLSERIVSGEMELRRIE